MLIERIKCPHCKEEINSFYIYNGFCPVCKKTFASSAQKISNTGLQELRTKNRTHKKETITKGQIKRIFKLTEEQILKIPSTNEFGEVRYYKTDVADFVNNLK